MNTNLFHDLKQTVSQVSGRTSKTTPFEFHGKKFPLKLTKNFLSTFKSSQEVQIELDGPKLCFRWNNGFAHINSITE